MKVLGLEINGFRGIGRTNLILSQNVAFVGPNGAGKSTIVDALSLVFGRQKLVRELTEHDFTGSCPKPADRIRIVATLGGFPSNNPAEHSQWFRQGRAIIKWWNPDKRLVEATQEKHSQLCVQIGYAARFDHDELVVEQKRYFHDDDEVVDPFMEDGVATFPAKLLNEIGYFVLPARRTWASTISFNSELFRRAVSTLGNVPATSILKHRDELRSPASRLEDDPAIQPLVDRINAQMAQLLPGKPRLQLRVTSTDSESLLQSLVPHFERENGASLPAGRHGTGLVSLQTLVLLLEIGRSRRDEALSFILALEEPELHVPPGLQRRLLGEATQIADQVICTTHSPRVAAFFDAEEIQILTPGYDENGLRLLEGRALTTSSMVSEPNAINQLYTDDRTRLVEALMFPSLLVPEGRIDFEWLRLLLDVVETGKRSHAPDYTIPPFGSVLGLVPTRDSAVTVTYQKLRSLHENIIVLVDGDSAGDKYLSEVLGCDPPPTAVLQWPTGWSIENVVGWLISADETNLISEIQERLGRQLDSLNELINALQNSDGRTGGLKSHYVAHEEIAAALKKSTLGVERADKLLETLTRAPLNMHEGSAHLYVDEERTTEKVTVYRFNP